MTSATTAVAATVIEKALVTGDLRLICAVASALMRAALQQDAAPPAGENKKSRRAAARLRQSLLDPAEVPLQAGAHLPPEGDHHGDACMPQAEPGGNAFWGRDGEDEDELLAPAEARWGRRGSTMCSRRGTSIGTS